MKLGLGSAIISILSTSLALQGWPKQGTIVSGNAVQFSQASWDSNLADPNATGEYPITGFDISQTYPSQQVDGWRLSVNVTGSIPDSQTLTPNNGSDQAFTGTSIYMKAPVSTLESITSDTNATLETTWKICVTVMNGPTQSATDNGTCNSLSSQCVTDFQNAFADEFSKNQDCYKQPAIPQSCGNTLSQANMTTQQFPLASANGTEIFVTATDAHDSGDNAAFNAAAQQVWPVLTVWGWNTRAKVSDDTRPTVQLTCVKANTVTPGSSSPSVASTYPASAFIALGVAAASTLILL